MWTVWILFGFLSAGVSLALLQPLARRGHSRADRVIRISVCILPLLALALYLRLGRPDLPGTSGNMEALQERNELLLTQKPLETLVRTDPHDVGALTSLGDSYMRLREYDKALRFYRAAAASAKARNDARLPSIEKTLNQIQAEKKK